MRKTLALTAAAALALTLGGAGVAAAAAPSYTATFTPGQTDGLRPVAGTVTFTNAGNGLLRAQGSVSGLEASQTYVTVAYRDGYCLPTPGITAYPSGSWRTDSTGAATFDTIVNPKGINPVGQVAVADIHSMSVRQVLVNSVTVPGVPINTPNAPNVLATEACDGS